MAILTVLREQDVEGFVGAFALGALRTATGIEAGTVNTSYALELDHGRFFLRIYEEQDHAGAEREAALLVHLAGRGIATPAPLRGADGATVRTLAGKPAALFPWIDGEMLCQRAVRPEAAAAVGAALAAVHLAGPAPEISLGGGRFGPRELEARCDRVAMSGDADAAREAEPLRAAVREVAARRARDLPSGLVHGDLFRDNVLWAGDKIAALLDFESAHHGPFAYDLAVTILSWSYSDDFDLDLARAIVDGYRSRRELTPAERTALFDEAILATLRFTITRITDEAIRVGKRWQRFVERRAALERLGPAGLEEALAL